MLVRVQALPRYPVLGRGAPRRRSLGPGPGSGGYVERQAPPALRSVPHDALQSQPSQAGGEDDERLGDLLHVGEDGERRQTDGHGGDIDERAPTEHEGPPAIAPVAAAVTPSTNAFTRGSFTERRK